MLKVGLTGGYATGKSFVAGELARLGCHVIHADLLGHAVLEPGGEAYAATVEGFGAGILASDGSIDRKKLAAVVFENPDLLQKLNAFVHPAVIRLEEEWLNRFAREDPRGIAVIEAAILIELGRHGVFDKMILAACDEETQIARGMKRDHITREQVLSRLARQLPLEVKKQHADYVIDTSGSKEDTIQQVDKVFQELKRLAEAQA